MVKLHEMILRDAHKYILVTTDRIRTSFIEKFPFGAGFSSILVSVDDIYACGGIPIAASLIISVKKGAAPHPTGSTPTMITHGVVSKVDRAI